MLDEKMTKKEDFVKNINQSFLDDFSRNANECNHYSNLNLNQNQRYPTLIPVHSSSKSFNDKYCDGKRIAAVLEIPAILATLNLPDSTVSEPCEGHDKSKLLNKSSPINSCSKTSTSLTYDKKPVDEKVRNRWKKDSDKTTNKSTLSLHIANYENSSEAAASDSFGNNESEKKEESESLKKQGNTRHFVITSTFLIQNPFEFPRQQNYKIPRPEMSQFRASQQLRIPQRSILSSSKKSTNSKLDKTTSFDHIITHLPLSPSSALFSGSGMLDRTAAMLQQLYQQQQRRQQHTPSTQQSIQNGIRTPNGTTNMFDTQTSNGTSIQFASNTGTGGTWQRNNATPSSQHQQQQQQSNGYMNGYSMMGGLINGSSGLIAFKCCECSITKNSCEELEIHIKTEHLNWLPFRCLKCPAVRASDTQMREHMFSAHKNEKNISLNHYAYIDNPNAKRELQTMLDRALTDAAASISRKTHSSSVSSSSSRHPAQKRQRTSEAFDDMSAEQTQPMASATITVHPKTTTNDILAQIQAARSDDDDPMENGLASVTEGNDDQPGDLDDFTNSQLSQVFGGPLAETLEDYTNGYVDGNDSRTLIENISALLGNPPPQPENTYTAPNGKIVKTRAPRGSRQINCVSKKRVLGECSRCQKPVTAGARQMHMFYHLGKDYNTYRFKCKFDDCEIEHYRKDQMENHQSKQHGRIDPDMMEDRSQELADMVQQLSMELLGTVGNQPGPTAEKAQIMYDNQQKEIAEAQIKKRKRYSFAPTEYSANGSYLQTSPSTSSIPSPKSNGLKLGSGGSDMESHYKRNEEHIKCLMCEKTMLTRVKGFHILSHLFNDLGIIRFNCKHCDFKNERRQSVSQHGRREHQDENCVEDSLEKYDEEVKSLSKACFGVEQSFATRSKKSELDAKSDENVLFVDDLDDPELDENGEASELSEGAVKNELSSPIKDPLLASLTDVMKSSTPKGNGNLTITTPSSSKKKSTRRFGTRRPKSKKQKLEMAKLRELSLVLGGAQYFRKRANDTACCQKCFKPTQSRLTHHAYSHLDDVHLFQCPECQLGHSSRDQVVKHMKDLHNSTKPPIDNRLKYAQEIKDAIKECYPDYFIDAPIPTTATVEKLRGSIDFSDTVLSGFDESIEHENDENVSDTEENHVDDEEGEHPNESHEAEEDEEEIPKLFPNDAIEEEAMEESNDASVEA